MRELGQWRFTCDRAATESAYSRVDLGGSQSCNCSGCRNFLLARDKVFPPTFVSLLQSLGIDPTKDAEVYHIGQTTPGQHGYGGWFHFVGELLTSGDFATVELAPKFQVWLCYHSAPALKPFEGLPLVQLEFEISNVPWSLNEVEVD